MKKITLSINPLYLCNFKCHFCYLTPEQLNDSKRLDLSLLKLRLEEVRLAGLEVDHVDLYGGEIALLGEDYLSELDDILASFGDPTINIITNLSKVTPYFLREHVSLSVSFDFEAREKSELVLNNMITLDKSISVLMLASKELLEIDVERMIRTFNGIQNICSVEIKPYSSNQSNQLNVSDRDFELFVEKWLWSKSEKRFSFTNEEAIRSALNNSRNSFSDDHIYITPEGSFSVLEFDSQDNEFFLKLNSLEEYTQWAKEEKLKVQSNPFCSKCKYVGCCLTEHYRDVKDLSSSCNGFYNLIENYSKSLSENKVGTE